MNDRHAIRTAFAAAVTLFIVGCSTVNTVNPDANLVAFSTTLRGANEVPSVMTAATGTVDAVLNKDTRLFRWKMSFSGLSGPATMAHFHGPAAVGTNAKVRLPFPAPITSPYSGRATLTPEQVSELMAGKWYANVHTAAHPGGEIRGWMVVVR